MQWPVRRRDEADGVAVNRIWKLQENRLRKLICEHRIAPGLCVRVIDFTSHSPIFEENHCGELAIIEMAFEFLFALQHLDPRRRKLLDHLTAPPNFNAMQIEPGTCWV